MKLKDPLQLRNHFAEKGVISQDDIAKALPLSTRTVSRMLNGEPVRYGTVRKIAKFLGKNEAEIAEFVAEN